MARIRRIQNPIGQYALCNRETLREASQNAPYRHGTGAGKVSPIGTSDLCLTGRRRTRSCGEQFLPSKGDTL